MNKKVILGKKVWLTVAAFVFAICMGVGAVFAVPGNGGAGSVWSTGSLNAGENATTSSRVEMRDLFLRYNMDAVIGPIDAVDTNNDGVIDRKDLDNRGRYTYKSTNFDVNGDPTNNVYGIPASRYFDVENYIFTKEDTTYKYTDGNGNKSNGRILYGWKPAIRAVNPGEGHKSTPGAVNRQIAENGEILSGGYFASTAQPIGIYVRYGAQFFGTTFKYALIVPDYVTSVGRGSAAFVGYAKDTDTTLTTYYQDTAVAAGTTNAAEFTDFGAFMNMSGAINDAGAPYFWQPRERLAGVYFTKDSALQEIVGGTKAASNQEYSSNKSNPNGKGKSAFTNCDNLRFMVLPGE